MSADVLGTSTFCVAGHGLNQLYFAIAALRRHQTRLQLPSESSADRCCALLSDGAVLQRAARMQHRTKRARARQLGP